jgi:hypothetical protein
MVKFSSAAINWLACRCMGDGRSFDEVRCDLCADFQSATALREEKKKAEKAVIEVALSQVADSM